MSCVLISDWWAWHKNPYKDPPEAFSKEAAEKHENQKTEAEPVKIEGENAAETVPGRICTHSNITNTATMMKREYSTSGLWVCGISLISLLFYVV
jgi:hypothetical protein